ncbi:hypothetical protein [Streptomyces nojiriensis]|uniref:hypothetical protein n=1 Tax=Streptomyces nojiriensis TaxID=66374 RepID=UPI0036AFD9FD
MNLPYQTRVFSLDRQPLHAQEKKPLTDKDVEQTDSRGYGPGPWWAELGTWGAVGLITFGVVAAAWVFLRLPGTPENLATGYYQAAKLLAIGLVLTGSTLLGRTRRDARRATSDDAAS